MNIKQALSLGDLQLKSLENPRLEAEVLLAGLLNCARTNLKARPEAKLSLSQQIQYRIWLWSRRHHTPTAYILGYVKWNGLKLSVNPHTLIPRDETESLCFHIKAQSKSAPSHILDLGTGSGCLAIWLKQQFPDSLVMGSDISPTALKVAQHNANTHQTQIHWLQGNLLEPLDDEQHIDLIVANLPYVPSTMNVSQEVQKEPHSALFSGPDGLNHIRRLQQQLQQKQIQFNQLWLEFLPSQSEAIKSLFADYHVELFPAVDGQFFFACISSSN